MGNMIEVNDVAIEFDLTDHIYTAVQGVSLAIEKGRFVVVIGPTGCGKSTILNAVAGLIKPAQGEVRIEGERLAGINRRAGYLFQKDTLLPWATVIENMALGLRYRGISKAERLREAREWIGIVGLRGFEDAYPHQLSGGMRKRASIAQVWAVDPEIILMDEPFGALDVQVRQLMENELLNLWSGSGKTVLFVTHDLDEAVALADEVVLLSAGPASRIVGRYPVDIPRPRSLLDVRSTPEFIDVHQRIWADLKQEVMASYGTRK